MLFFPKKAVSLHPISQGNMDKLSYALGLNFGQYLKQENIKAANYNDFAKGIETACESTQPLIPITEAQQLLNDYFKQLEANKKAAAERTAKAGELFLTANATRPEVTTLPSGLQYEVLKNGNGTHPKTSDRVKVHYHGTLIDGTVFDSSVRRGEPATFGVTQVIQGWVEALQLMSVGSKWKLYIPHNLAYGAHGSGNTIKPYSTLVFEVELLDIV